MLPSLDPVVPSAVQHAPTCQKRQCSKPPAANPSVTRNRSARLPLAPFGSLAKDGAKGDSPFESPLDPASLFAAVGRAWGAAGALALSALLVSCGGPGSSSNSVVPPIPQSVHVPAPSVATTFCVHAASDQNEFPMPTAADLAALSTMHIGCVRLPIGDNAVQYADFVNEATAYSAAGISTLGITYAHAPPATVFQAPGLRWLEVGNELDLSMSATQAIAYTKGISVAARAANPSLLIVSGGTSGYDQGFLSATIPALKPYIDCVGVHPYGQSPSSFGAIASAVYSTYGLPACFTEWQSPNASDLTTALAASIGSTPVFGYFDLAQLEQNPSLAAAMKAGAR